VDREDSHTQDTPLDELRHVQMNEVASRITNLGVRGDAVLSLPSDAMWLQDLNTDRTYTAQQLLHMERSRHLKLHRSSLIEKLPHLSSSSDKAAPQTSKPSTGCLSAILTPQATQTQSKPKPIKRRSSSEIGDELRVQARALPSTVYSVCAQARARIAVDQSALALPCQWQATAASPPPHGAAVAEATLPHSGCVLRDLCSHPTLRLSDPEDDHPHPAEATDISLCSPSMQPPLDPPPSISCGARPCHPSGGAVGVVAAHICTRRGTPGLQMEESSSGVPDWAALPKDVLVALMQCLDVSNIVAMSGVCKLWRLAAVVVRPLAHAFATSAVRGVLVAVAQMVHGSAHDSAGNALCTFSLCCLSVMHFLCNLVAQEEIADCTDLRQGTCLCPDYG
jgi:hypothetical protein